MRNAECVSSVNTPAGDSNVEKLANRPTSVPFVTFSCAKRNVSESTMKWLMCEKLPLWKYPFLEFEWNKTLKAFLVLVWKKCSSRSRKWWLVIFRSICMLKLVIQIIFPWVVEFCCELIGLILFIIWNRRECQSMKRPELEFSLSLQDHLWRLRHST